MKFKESFKKPLTTLFVFILGIFVVSGLSYITTVMGAAPNNPPSSNTFIPINTGSVTQGRCRAENTDQVIDVYDSNNNLTAFYDDCKDGGDGYEGSAVLFTNGVFVKTPKTKFQITGDPSSNYKYGALYAGCTGDSGLISDTNIRDKCGGAAPGSQPEVFLYGDINMIDLIDQNQTGEKPLCISAGGTNKPPKGQVMVCP
ncbi:MAG: hypothetical protein KBB86_02025 [Candidatus Pacebacteria bacterium]|nr:hypothetical protein [Candidatus Paceibacterota bacterium]